MRGDTNPGKTPLETTHELLGATANKKCPTMVLTQVPSVKSGKLHLKACGAKNNSNQKDQSAYSLEKSGQSFITLLHKNVKVPHHGNDPSSFR